MKNFFILFVCTMLLVGCGKSVTDLQENDKTKHEEPNGAVRTAEACGYDEVKINYTSQARQDSPFNYWREKQRNDPAHRITLQLEQLGTQPQFILGYPQNFSEPKGEVINILYSAGLGRVGNFLESATVYHAVDHEIVKVEDFAPRQKLLTIDDCVSYFKGCQFPNSIELNTEDLEQGIYYAILSDDLGAKSAAIYFHIAPTIKEVSKADIVVVLSELTWHAYNNFGGGSLYRIDRINDDQTFTSSTSSISRFRSISTQRPLVPFTPNIHAPIASTTHEDAIRRISNAKDINPGKPSKIKHSTVWLKTSPEGHLVFQRHLDKLGYKSVTLSQHDIQRNPKLLENANAVLLTAHNEYWTQGMHDTFEKFIKNSGKILNFSGNLMWWRISWDGNQLFLDQNGNNRSETCIEAIPRGFRNTGLSAYGMGTATDEWMGVNYRWAMYPLKNGLNYDETYRTEVLKVPLDADFSRDNGITIIKPQHSLFKGIKLSDELRIFENQRILRIEIDGAPINDDFSINRDFSPLAPPSTRVLGVVDAFVPSISWNIDVTQQYSGVKTVGFIVETIPSGSGGNGYSLSIPTIGYSTFMFEKDPVALQLVENAMAIITR